jgi:capsular polysaccharide biosynthesis protein
MSFLLRWWWILLLGPIVAASSAAWSAGGSPPAYSSTATILIVNQTTLDASERLINTYAALVKLRPALTEIRTRLSLNETEESLAKKISVSTTFNSQLIRITARDENPILAANIANTAATVFVTRTEGELTRPMPTTTPDGLSTSPDPGRTSFLRIVEQASPSTDASKANIAVSAALAAALGLLISASICVGLDTVGWRTDFGRRVIQLASRLGEARSGDPLSRPRTGLSLFGFHRQFPRPKREWLFGIKRLIPALNRSAPPVAKAETVSPRQFPHPKRGWLVGIKRLTPALNRSASPVVKAEIVSPASTLDSNLTDPSDVPTDFEANPLSADVAAMRSKEGKASATLQEPTQAHTETPGVGSARSPDPVGGDYFHAKLFGLDEKAMRPKKDEASSTIQEPAKAQQKYGGDWLSDFTNEEVMAIYAGQLRSRSGHVFLKDRSEVGDILEKRGTWSSSRITRELSAAEEKISARAQEEAAKKSVARNPENSENVQSETN